MRAVLTSFGTTGCTQPVLALAVEMRRHGHDPVVALPTRYRARADQLGLEFVPLGPYFANGQDAQAGIAELTSDPDKQESFDHMYSLGAVMAEALPEVYRRLNEACRHADVLISKSSQPAARMIHELTGIPFVAFHTFYLPGSKTELGDEGTPTYRQVTELHINDFRSRLGLPPLADPMTRNGDSPLLTLNAISRHVVPMPGGWPPHYHMPGYFFLDENGWEPDADLVKFIEAGEPPVVISFGSMQHADPARVTEVLVKAVGLAGCRAIIQHGSSRLGRGQPLPRQVFAAEAIPHAWLFPRAACVVHHGGSGTTAATFRAGVPGVFIPHIYDQPIWAEIAANLGCAGPPVHFSEMTVERLAWAIASTLANRKYARTTAALGEKIRAERGVEKARQLIEELVCEKSPHKPVLPLTATPNLRADLAGGD